MLKLTMKAHDPRPLSCESRDIFSKLFNLAVWGPDRGEEIRAVAVHLRKDGGLLKESSCKGGDDLVAPGRT